MTRPSKQSLAFILLAPLAFHAGYGVWLMRASSFNAQRYTYGKNWLYVLQRVTGVVKSQTDHSLFYACSIDARGRYMCCTQNLNVCGGLRGKPCKHLLVLLVGLAQGAQVDPATALNWVRATRGKKAALDKDSMSATFIRYKGAEAGEVDWRPTETIPEDYYAF